MGGANVGPEFTSVEYQALKELQARELTLVANHPDLELSEFLPTLQAAVVASGRWKKWLLPEEQGMEFQALAPARQDWLFQTGARYIWTDPAVLATRDRLYANLAPAFSAPHDYVVEQIARVIEKYLSSFNLVDSLSKLG